MVQQRKNPEERKHEILDAAEKLFYEKDYTKTTINDILKAVGIAKGTFYYHFESKEEVLDAIVDRYIQNGLKMARKIALNNRLNPVQKIIRILKGEGSKDGAEQETLEQIHQVDNAQFHQKSLSRTIISLAPLFTQIVEQGIEQGYFRTPYPQETIEMILLSGQILFDKGFFNWVREETEDKATAFAYNMEKLLGAKAGSFSEIVGIISK
jgi:AcrR family transcriptional regulator